MIAQWLCEPKAAEKLIPQQALPLHLNLWLFHGQPPQDGREVEVIVSRFTFTPEKR